MDNIVSGPTEHCHAPSIDVIPVLQLKNKMKSRATETEELPSTILNSVMRSFPLDSAAHLPRHDTLLRTIRRQRQIPTTGDSNKIPDHLRQTDRGEDFIFYEDQNMVILTTKSNLSVLKDCKHWFADGTFKVRKKISEAAHQ